MDTWQIAILIGYGAVVLATAARHVALTFYLRRLPLLSPDSASELVEPPPKVSILVPAKDEERSIEQCVRSLLALDYPALELLVVDDRSSDRTAAILERLAAEDARLRLVQIAELPPGWTGKTHALQFAQQQATGEWLLFVDADTHLAPACLKIVLRHAIDHRLDLLSLLPTLEMRSFWECVVQPLAGACLFVFYPLPKVNDPAQRDFGCANGQFILVRRAAYDQLGGHTSVRDKFVEDIHLGRLARRSGLALRLDRTRELFWVRMYAGWGEIVRGWSRICYAGVDGRPLPLLRMLLLVLVFSGLSYPVLAGAVAGMLLFEPCSFLSGMLVLGLLQHLLQGLFMVRVYQQTGSPARYVLLRSLAVVSMLVILAKALWMCGTKQVTWRGTRYGAGMESSRS